MTNKFGTIIDFENWEAYIIDPLSPMVSTSREKRALPNRKSNPIERGLVIRDKVINQSVFLPPVGALEILKDMREVKTWKTNGIVIGSPALTSASHDEKARDEDILHTPFIRRNPEYVFSKHLRLTPEQSKDLFDFLIKNEQLLNEFAEKDEIIARQQLKDLFGKIADYGRKRRLNKS